MTGFIDTYNNQQGYDERFAGKDVGPYVGVVKYTNDPTRQGKLGVNIPELTLTNNPSPADCIWCNYLSPFYGAKSVEATSKSDPNDYKSTQHSYGFWAVPPDIDTEVLVIFAKGEANRKNAFWIRLWSLLPCRRLLRLRRRRRFGSFNLLFQVFLFSCHLLLFLLLID